MDKQAMTPEQRAAVENQGGTLLVSAAAGSGKTMVLVGRLMELICDKNRPHNISDFLIITYTRAAAAELRAKISAELSSRLAQNPTNTHLQRQMSLLYLAQISTVHSFCASILKQYAWEVGLTPDFRVGEERDCDVLRQQAICAVLESSYEGKQGPDDDDREMSDKEKSDFRFLADTLGAGRNDDSLGTLILQVYNAMNTHLDPERWLEECLQQGQNGENNPWCRYLLRHLVTQIEGWQMVMQHAAELARTDRALLIAYTPSIERTIQQFDELLAAAAQGWEAVCCHPAVQNPKLLFEKLSAARNADTECQERIKCLRDMCKKQMEKLLPVFSQTHKEIDSDLQRTAPALRAMIALTKRFSADYRRRKQRRGILDFSDLEHYALRLLTESKTNMPSRAASEISRRFAQVLVDEYQDTNAVQDAIFFATSQKGNNLFFVGDVKQSIYRFRLADPTIFLTRYERYAPAAEAKEGQPRKILLSRNFRSRPEVLEAVNGVFEAVMSPLIGDLQYGPDEKLTAAAKYPSRSVPVELHITENDTADPEQQSLRRPQVEAALVAERIRSLLDEPFCIQDGDILRPVTPGDIVILLRSPKASAADFIAALREQGIAAATGQSGSLLQTPEVQVLISYLQVIDNPCQDIPLAAVLASPVFGFTAAELAEIRLFDRSGSFYDALLAAAPDYPRVQKFSDQLNHLRSRASTLSVGKIVWAALQETSMETIYAADNAGAAARTNLLTVFHLACQFEAGANRGLNAFLQWLQDQAENLTSSTAKSNAVSILSIHKSKGLEYPVVILADLARSFNTADLSSNVLSHPQLGIASRAIDPDEGQSWTTAATQAVSTALLQETKSEELRVLYVAMTRAKEKLILSYCDKNPAAQLARIAACASLPVRPVIAQTATNMGTWILMHAVTRPEAGALWQLAGLRPDRTVCPEYAWDIQIHSGQELLSRLSSHKMAADRSEGAKDTTDPTELARALCFQYPYRAATVLPTKRTATQLKGRIQDQEAAEQTEDIVTISFPSPQFSHAELTPAQRGTAVHLAMQYADYRSLQTPDDARAELLRLQQAGYLTERQAEAVDPVMLCKFFHSQLGRRVLGCAHVVREFKFSILTDAARFDPDAAGEQIMLQGMVDCCLIEEDGLVVIDFKTDSIRAGQEAQRAETYRYQLQAYSEALSRIFKKPVRQKVLFFFSTGQMCVFDDNTEKILAP